MRQRLRQASQWLKWAGDVAPVRRTSHARDLIAARRRALMFPTATFDVTSVGKLIALARERGHNDPSRLRVKCAACGAGLLPNIGLAHEPNCVDPKRIEFTHVDSLIDRLFHRRASRR